jgi:hypothetical protein
MNYLFYYNLKIETHNYNYILNKIILVKKCILYFMNNKLTKCHLKHLFKQIFN